MISHHDCRVVMMLSTNVNPRDRLQGATRGLEILGRIDAGACSSLSHSWRRDRRSLSDRAYRSKSNITYTYVYHYAIMRPLLLSLALLALVLHQQGADAFLPRPAATQNAAAPWGVRTAGSDQPQRQQSAKDTVSLSRRGAQSISNHQRQSQVAFSRAAASSSSTSLFATSAPKIVIAGAPASGKGTQCEKIQERFGVVHLSTGDMLRAAVAAGTEVGKEAKSYMDSGKLVPDSTIIGVVRNIYLLVVLYAG